MKKLVNKRIVNKLYKLHVLEELQMICTLFIRDLYINARNNQMFC